MKRLLISLSLAAAAFGAGLGVQQNATVKVAAEGYGITEQAALYQALGNAVRNANGTEIAPNSALLLTESHAFDRGYRSYERIAYTSEQVTSSYRGYVKNYEILESGQRKIEAGGDFGTSKDEIGGSLELVAGEEQAGTLTLDGEKKSEQTSGRYITCYYVKVLAEVYRYESPFKEAKDEMVRLIVLPFDGALSFSAPLADGIQEALAGANRFNILDRARSEEFAKERNIWLSNDANIAEKSRLSMVLGADMMLTGTIRECKFVPALRDNSNRQRELYKLEIDVEYSLISVPDRAVKYQSSKKLTLTPAQLDAINVKVVPSDLALNKDKVLRSIAAQLGEQIAYEACDYVYPVLVAKVDGGRIYLNQGAGRLKDGQKFTVYSKGEEVIDPQTKLSLGAVEKPVAVIAVGESLDKMSIASLLRGDISAVKAGDKCRMADSEQESAPVAAAVAAAGYGKHADVDAVSRATPAALSAAELRPKKIAVIAPRTYSERYRVMNSIAPADIVGERFASALTSAMSKTGRFTVLDRGYQAEYDVEIDLLMKDGKIDGIMDKVEQIDAADYLLAGTISQFYVTKENVNIAAAGLTSTRYNVIFYYDYRIIELKTREILFSDIMSLVWDDDAVKREVPGLEFSDELDLAENSATASVLGAAARAATAKFVDQLYPVVIIGREGDRVALNAGNSVLRFGEMLSVYSAGKEMKDPYSGRSLGRFEGAAGTVRVVETNADVSYAVVVDENEEIGEGAICRQVATRAARTMRRPEPRRSNIRKTESGGVKLPFDR
ncbi:MAG: CsgG/HfaB family protein [Phycisphaerae bacterium]